MGQTDGIVDTVDKNNRIHKVINKKSIVINKMWIILLTLSECFVISRHIERNGGEQHGNETMVCG